MNIGLKWLFFPAGQEEKYEARKFVLLSLAYFFVIATYTLVKVLKDTLFIDIVGQEYIPWAKLLSMFILVPAVLFYSFLVDRLRRYQLLFVYSSIYAISLLVSLFVVAHPTLGISNATTSPYRLFGWFFYFLIEGYSPFMVSVFWSFVNSVSDPKGAKRSYGLLVAMSKIGGIISALIGMAIFALPLYLNMPLSHVANHQIIIGVATFFVSLVPVTMYVLMRTIPGRFLHGYEAAYQFEKKRSHKENPGVFDGLKMFVKYPYIFGIFGMVFFYEIVYTMLNFMRLGITKDAAQHISEVTQSLFWQDFLMHSTGFFISLLGTQFLMRSFSERVCLLLVPLSAMCLLLALFFSPSIVVTVVIALRAIHYAFATPLREALYIPTIKEVKFKSKSWIDAFGSKLSKGTGSVLRIISLGAGKSMFFPVSMAILGVLTLLWTGIAIFMGNQYMRVIARNKVIGSEEETN